MKNKEFKKLKHGDKLEYNSKIYIFDRYDKILQRVYLGGVNEEKSFANKQSFVKQFELIK